MAYFCNWRTYTAADIAGVSRLKHAGILGVVEKIDIVLWPVAMDFKCENVAALPDKATAATLLNGAIRSSEQEEMALLSGRPAEDMPQITSRICGVCPAAHHMAATKTLDALDQFEPTSASRKIRELVYHTFMLEDHALHGFVLGGPDFIVGREAPPRAAQHRGRTRRTVELPEVHLPEKRGRKGFVEGPDSSIYSVAPRARLIAAAGMATPRAQAAYEEHFQTLGGKPVHHTLANQWARVVEIVYAAERIDQLSNDPEITSPEVRRIPTAN